MLCSCKLLYLNSNVNLRLCSDTSLVVLPPQQRWVRLPQHTDRHSVLSNSSAWPLLKPSQGHILHHAGSLMDLHFADLALHSCKHLEVQEIEIRSRSVVAWSYWRVMAAATLRDGF